MTWEVTRYLTYAVAGWGKLKAICTWKLYSWNTKLVHYHLRRALEILTGLHVLESNLSGVHVTAARLSLRHDAAFSVELTNKWPRRRQARWAELLQRCSVDDVVLQRWQGSSSSSSSRSCIAVGVTALINWTRRWLAIPASTYVTFCRTLLDVQTVPMDSRSWTPWRRFRRGTFPWFSVEGINMIMTTTTTIIIVQIIY